MSRSSGGPAPQGNSWRPIYFCEACGTMSTSSEHTCRQATHETEQETEREAACCPSSLTTTSS